MNCPSCNSENTQTINMVLLSGSSTSQGNLVGADIQGDVAVAKLSTISQTKLAASLDPGVKPGNGAGGCWYGCGGLIALCSIGAFADPKSAGVGVPWLVGGLILIGIGRGFQQSAEGALPKKIAEWERKTALKNRGWICHKCGGTWLPKS